MEREEGGREEGGRVEGGRNKSTQRERERGISVLPSSAGPHYKHDMTRENLSAY